MGRLVGRGALGGALVVLGLAASCGDDEHPGGDGGASGAGTQAGPTTGGAGGGGTGTGSGGAATSTGATSTSTSSSTGTGGAPPLGDEVTVALVAGDGVTGATVVNFAVPLQPGQLADATHVRVLAAGVEIEAATRPLAAHPDGSPRSVQVQIEVDPAATAEVVVVLGEAPTAGQRELLPVEDTLVAPDGIEIPRVWAVLPASWLSASGVAELRHPPPADRRRSLPRGRRGHGPRDGRAVAEPGVRRRHRRAVDRAQPGLRPPRDDVGGDGERRSAGRAARRRRRHRRRQPRGAGHLPLRLGRRRSPVLRPPRRRPRSRGGQPYFGCSPWMSAILADGLDAYARVRGGERADAVRASLVQLGRIVARDGIGPDGRPHDWMGVGTDEDAPDAYDEHVGESAYVVALARAIVGAPDPELDGALADLLGKLAADGTVGQIRSYNWQCRTAVMAPTFAP